MRIINGILTVAVSSGPWIQELTYLKTMMKGKLNDRLGAEVVRDIILRSGRVIITAEPVEDLLPIKRKLTSLQQAKIAEQAAAIEDSEIREAFVALMTASAEVK